MIWNKFLGHTGNWKYVFRAFSWGRILMHISDQTSIQIMIQARKLISFARLFCGEESTQGGIWQLELRGEFEAEQRAIYPQLMH